MSQKNKFKFSAGAVGAVAIGSFAVGAFAIGALAIGRLCIRRFAVQKGSLASLEIGELTVRRLKVKELQVEDTLQLPGAQGRELREPAEPPLCYKNIREKEGRQKEISARISPQGLDGDCALPWHSGDDSASVGQ